jgi:S1-C subfamily serine protease
VWSVPDNAPLPPGALLFTDGGELVGLVDEPRNGPTVVPGMLVIQAAGQLVDNPPGPVAESGVQVQALTRPIADATGAAGGVVVTWVDRTGPAAGRLRVGDVIEGAGGQLIAGPEHWDVRASRAPVGKPLPLLVRRGGKVIDVELVPRARPATPTLGLVLRAVPGAGAEVVRVQPGSAAARAGLAPPDLITVVAGIQAPTPSQVTAAYASARPGQPVLVAVTRGDRHQVLTLAR